MASTVRGSSFGREKRGTSPSSSMIKKSPKPSTSTSAPRSSSSSPTKEKNPSHTDGKPVPNYLKPTISSNLDFSRIPKKSSSESSTQKPDATRRKSIDRPPSASQGQRGVRNVPGPREVKPLRSTSFSHKSSTSSSAGSSLRPSSERPYARTTSTLKEGKNDSVVSKSRILRKSSSTLSSSAPPATKKERSGAISSSSSKKAPKSVTSESSIDQDNQAVDRLVVEDDLISVENDDQSLPEISEMPDSNEELGDPTITFIDVQAKPVENVQDNLAVSEQQNVQEHKQVEHQNYQTVENLHDSPAVSEQQNVDEDHHKQEEQHYSRTVEPTQPEPKNVQESSDDKDLTVEEQNTIVQEQNMPVEAQNLTVAEQNLTVESDEPQNVEAKETELAEENSTEQKPEKPNEEQEAKVENQTASSPVPTSTPGPATAAPEPASASATPAPAALEPAVPAPAPAATPTPAAARTPAPARGQTASSGKKDKQQAYNDIIEQTSTKLMGGRKNKVLALAGAFETVISLQDTNKN